jgi:GT2 family glycosyltransferase
MFWKTIDLLQYAGRTEATAPQSIQHRFRVPVGAERISGWYRLKLGSAQHILESISIRAYEAGALSNPVYSFSSLCFGNRFHSYVFISSGIERVDVCINARSSQDDGLVITMRPIALIEYLWHSLRRGLLRRPQDFLSYYFRPLKRFLIAPEFPSPPRFSNADELYQAWISKNEASVTQTFTSGMTGPANEIPIVAVLLPVCDPRPEYLRKAIASVQAQTSPRWQLCIADDASTAPEIRQILDQATGSDTRISVSYCEQRGGVSRATNAAFAQSSSPFVTCLGHDDMLAPAAIEASARHLAANPACRLLFSDEDKIDASDRRFMPFFKSRQFSRELFYSYNYMSHMTTHRADTVSKVGAWNSAYDGAQGYDLILRSMETMSDRDIHHIPLVLYHWRAIAGSAALDAGHNSDAVDAGRRALNEHLVRCGVKAEVAMVGGSMYRVRRTIPTPAPKISILIPFRDRADLLGRCIASILNKTRYDNYEIILVNNASSERKSLELVESLRSSPSIRILQDDRPFNYSQLNNFAAENSNGEYLCLLNSDTEVISDDWLEEMLGYASVPDIGCVGAKLYYPGGSIQHAGLVLGIAGVASHLFLNSEKDAPGYFGRLQVAANYTAVTGACLMIKRSVYMQVGGLDEADLPVSCNDIDFCIKVQALGYRNVVTPFAELIHHESSTRGRDDTPEKWARAQQEHDVMKKRYGEFLYKDPCYSPHLTLENVDCSVQVS